MHTLLHALPLFCVIALSIKYQRSRLAYRRKINSTLRHSSSQLQTISGCVFKQGNNTHSSLYQSNLQLQNQAVIMSRRIRAVEHRCATGLAGALPRLKDRILLIYSRIENAHKVRKKTFVLYAHSSTYCERCKTVVFNLICTATHYSYPL